MSEEVENVHIVKWNHTNSTQHLIFFVSKYVVDLHKKHGLDNDKIAANCMKIADAMVGGKINNNDIIFSYAGILSIKKLEVDDRGYVIFQDK